MAVLVEIFDFGFNQSSFVTKAIEIFYTSILIIGILLIPFRWIIKHLRPKFKAILIDTLFLLFLLSVAIVRLNFFKELDLLHTIFSMEGWIYVAILFIFIREFSALDLNFKRKTITPAQLFVISFILLIIIGTGLLLLPNATNSGISLLNALFTSTSAVCVTGLIVVDTGSYFTELGQGIILLLIQVGGIGIMTFTSYFSYFFRGGTTFENQLMLSDMTNAEKISEVFGTLKKIIFITLIIELVGAAVIYSSIDDKIIPLLSDQIFFSVFHSISAFCNAGFSTLSDSLYDIDFRFNYPLHIVISLLFVLGGLGFPIAFNIVKYVQHLLVNKLFRFLFRKRVIHKPWVINLNTRIVFITTSILVAVGTVLFFAFEYDNTLAEHDLFGKIVTSFFGATTPRTAGFNSVDMSALNFSTLMILFLLMWIGASPASTGGGIKTSTLAIAWLNFISIAKGKDRIEVFKREISKSSVNRAFAIISLSLVVIGLGIFLLASFDPDKDLLSLAFECFSAYSTVGLSLGITAKLSAASKGVLIVIMIVGRVSMLTILIAIFRKISYLNYRYPTEEILIN